MLTQRDRELRERAARSRRLAEVRPVREPRFRRRTRTAAVQVPNRVTIRFAATADGPELRRLAALDEAKVPAAPALLAEVDGVAMAAVPVSGGPGVADPFFASEPLLRLLALRAEQIRAVDTAPRRISGLGRLALR
jgi:hypothetical protein